MRETHRGNRYSPGDYWRECPICGFDYLRSEMKTRYDGLLVCTSDWEEDHPQLHPTYNHNHPPFRPEGMGATLTYVTTTTHGGYILTETGGYILDEDGNKIVTEG